jgi:hypothetical protein
MKHEYKRSIQKYLEDSVGRKWRSILELFFWGQVKGYSSANVRPIHKDLSSNRLWENLIASTDDEYVFAASLSLLVCDAV